MHKPDFETMFHPRSVAFIGVSASRNDRNFISFYLNQGFKGRIYPVNPKASEIMGYKAYPNIGSVPEKVDFVIVSVPAQLVPEILTECADAGANNIHIFTAGFKETEGDVGVEIEKRIKDIAKARGLSIIGPNGMGLYVPESGMVTWRQAPQESGPVGVISQSGSMAQMFSSCGAGAGFGFSKVISFGNGTVLDSTDFLEYFRDDPKTQIISMYLEGVADGRKLTRLVKEITPRKPVIILNGGLTDSGARAIVSHTGSLTSSEAVWDAFFKQTGAVKAGTFDELIDITMTFCHMLPMRGRRIAIIGGGGGPSVAFADSLAREGFDLPTFGEETQRQLRAFIPEAGMSIKNPLDAAKVVRDKAQLNRTLELVAADPAIDSLVIDYSLVLLRDAIRKATGSTNGLDVDVAGLSQFARDNVYRKPLAVMFGSTGHNTDVENERLRVQHELYKSRVAVFPSPARAARAFNKFARYYEFLRQVE